MTKLEQKLVELGYQKTTYYHQPNHYYKDIGGFHYSIYLSLDSREIVNSCMYNLKTIFTSQQDIDNLQQDNQLKQDLEVLRSVED